MRWTEIKQAAHELLENGWRAGRALEFLGGMLGAVPDS